MSLVRCPECGAKASDTAITCPQCGFTASGPEGIVPLSMLQPAPRQVQLRIPGAEIFEHGTSLVPAETNSKLVALFESADQVAKLAPSMCAAIQKLMEKRGTVWAADFSEAAQKLMDDGELVLSVEERTGKLLPQLRSVKTGQVYEKARLKAIDLPNDVASSLASVQMQLAMAELMSEIKSLAANVEALRLEAQGDRMARANAVWQRLEQATRIQDPQLRQAKILSIADAATEQRCILQENYNVELALATSGKGKSSDRGRAASTAIADLTVIALMARAEYASYALVGEFESAKVAFGQFQAFVSDNELNDRRTLLELNGRSNQNLDPAINKIHGLAQHVSALDLEAPEPGKSLPEANEESGDDDE